MVDNPELLTIALQNKLDFVLGIQSLVGLDRKVAAQKLATLSYPVTLRLPDGQHLRISEKMSQQQIDLLLAYAYDQIDFEIGEKLAEEKFVVTEYRPGEGGIEGPKDDMIGGLVQTGDIAIARFIILLYPGRDYLEKKYNAYGSPILVIFENSAGQKIGFVAVVADTGAFGPGSEYNSSKGLKGDRIVDIPKETIIALEQTGLNPDRDTLQQGLLLAKVDGLNPGIFGADNKYLSGSQIITLTPEQIEAVLGGKYNLKLEDITFAQPSDPFGNYNAWLTAIEVKAIFNGLGVETDPSTSE